jgi:nickel-dependent lactate racemase
MKRKFKISYGNDWKEFELESGLLATDPIAPRGAPTKMTPDQLKAEIVKALRSPVGRPPLREMAKGKKAAIVVSDEFRSGLQKEIIEVLLEEVSAGGPESIRVICATGTHEPSIYAGNVRAWAEAAAKSLGIAIEFVSNDCDGADFADLGRSPLGTRVLVNRHLLRSDLRVYGHESKHHYMAGYSCIDKQVVPGVSARKTVEDNHKRSLSPLSGPGRNPWHPDPSRRDNPFSTDARDIRDLTEGFFLDESEGMVRRKVETFALDMISSKTSIFWIAAGDPNLLCAAMPAKVDEEAMFTASPAKYVIVSPGGPPASQALYGVQNCFDMALMGAVQKGGEALVVAPCNGRPDLPPGVSGLAPDEKSKTLFWDNLVKMRDWDFERIRDHIENHFELYLWKTFRVLRLFKVNDVRIYLHCELSAALIEQGGFHGAPDVQAWIDERARRGDGKFNVIDQGNKIFVFSDQPT